MRIPACVWVAPTIPGGHADALKRRLGYLRAIGARRLFASRANDSPLTPIRLTGIDCAGNSLACS